MTEQEEAIEAVLRRVLVGAHRIEPDQVVQFVTAEARAAGIRDIDIFLVDQQQVHLSSVTSGGRHSVEGSLIGDTYRRTRAHVIDEDDGSHRVLAPLVDGEDRLGVMSVLVDEVGEDTVDDVQALASATAGLIVSKRHYTDAYEFVRRLEPMELAAEFRWALLPPLTLWSPRVRVAGMLEPAYEAAGDAFDYAVNGGIAHVALFDAVGHGMRACRLANLAIAAYRNCRRNRIDLAGTAAAIDATIADQFGESWFVTALLGELEVDRGQLRFLSAGHPLPMLLRNGKVVSTLEARPGLPFGLGGPVPEIAEAQLEPDDAFFMYSDGVTEARSGEGDFFGENRLSDYLARAAADELLPPETMRRLVVRLYEHSPAPLRDDATMLLVSWHRAENPDADASD
jgi:Stage II sporulation protein E (SpoIIE)